MIAARRTVRALLLSLLLCACASAPPKKITHDDIAPLFPHLYALDPAAPVAVRQLPFAHAYFGDDLRGPGLNTFGVTMELWPERAILKMDAAPLASQLAGVRRFADPAKQAARIRRNRWEVDLAKCPVVAELYTEAMAARERARTFTEGQRPSWTGAGGVTVQFAGVEVPREEHGFHQMWVSRAWQELDRCAHTSGRN